MSERRAEDGLISVTVSDGKYTIQQTEPGKWEALRYGEEWPAFRDSGPDNLHVALAYEVDRLRGELTEKGRARIGDSEIAGAYLCRAEKAEAQVAALKGEASFLIERLDDINLDDDLDDLIRDWNGHVEPSIARLRQLAQVTA